MTLTPSTPSYDCPRPSESISLSIHFGTLYFYRNPEKILQECSALQRSTVQCSATIQPYLKTPPICSSFVRLRVHTLRVHTLHSLHKILQKVGDKSQLNFARRYIQKNNMSSNKEVQFYHHNCRDYKTFT